MKLLEQTSFVRAQLRKMVREAAPAPARLKIEQHLVAIETAIERYDKRMEYIAEVMVPMAGTVLVYRDESTDYPMRCVVDHVTAQTIVVKYPSVRFSKLTFSRETGACATRTFENFRLDEKERSVLDQLEPEG